MRWIGGGLRRPPRKRSTASERPRFQRQRAREHRREQHRLLERFAQPSARNSDFAISSGKLCCGPSESTNASSLAAACSSKSNARQIRLRATSPSARLIRPPNGA
jgi:hypothetical protein